MTTPTDTMPDEVWIDEDFDTYLPPETFGWPMNLITKYIRADLSAAREAELMAQNSRLEGLLNIIADALDKGEVVPAIVPRLRTAEVTDDDIAWAKSVITEAQAQTKGEKT